MAASDPRQAEADILLNHVHVLAVKLATKPPGQSFCLSPASRPGWPISRPVFEGAWH
jgi:hypothetical protein